MSFYFRFLKGILQMLIGRDFDNNNFSKLHKNA